eukprot:4684975-Pyramimonas_sp.AAC.1
MRRPSPPLGRPQSLRCKRGQRWGGLLLRVLGEHVGHLRPRVALAPCCATEAKRARPRDRLVDARGLDREKAPSERTLTKAAPELADSRR